MIIPSQRAGRRITLAFAAFVALAAGAAAFASVAAGGDGPTLIRPQLASACIATSKLPKLLSPSPVALPDMVWDNRSDIHALVSFRLDRTGHPTNVIVTAAGLDKDAKAAVERAVVDAFGNYAFCPAGDFSTTLNWTAQLQFSPAPADAGDDDVRLYLQSFMAGYPGFGRFERHVGRVVVRATYGTDGRPRSVQVVKSSGDRILDDKSVDAMASGQVLFRNGVPPSRPISIERPFTYQP